MALHWDLTNIRNADAVCWYTAEHDNPNRGIDKGDTVLSGLTETLIWTTIAVGMPEITKANATEFATRLRVYERTFGAFRRSREGDMPVTLLDVHQHIGLKTNASRLTPAQFGAQVLARAKAEMLREAGEEIAKELAA